MTSTEANAATRSAASPADRSRKNITHAVTKLTIVSAASEPAAWT